MNLSTVQPNYGTNKGTPMANAYFKNAGVSQLNKATAATAAAQKKEGISALGNKLYRAVFGNNAEGAAAGAGGALTGGRRRRRRSHKKRRSHHKKRTNRNKRRTNRNKRRTSNRK